MECLVGACTAARLLGEASLAQERLAEAEALQGRSVEEDACLLAEGGLLAAGRGDHAAAAEALARAIPHYPRSSSLLSRAGLACSLALSLARLGMAEEALAVAKLAEAADPSVADLAAAAREAARAKKPPEQEAEDEHDSEPEEDWDLELGTPPALAATLDQLQGLRVRAISQLTAGSGTLDCYTEETTESFSNQPTSVHATRSGALATVLGQRSAATSSPVLSATLSQAPASATAAAAAASHHPQGGALVIPRRHRFLRPDADHVNIVRVPKPTAPFSLGKGRAFTDQTLSEWLRRLASKHEHAARPSASTEGFFGHLRSLRVLSLEWAASYLARASRCNFGDPGRAGEDVAAFRRSFAASQWVCCRSFFTEIRGTAPAYESSVPDDRKPEIVRIGIHMMRLAGYWLAESGGPEADLDEIAKIARAWLGVAYLDSVRLCECDARAHMAALRRPGRSVKAVIASYVELHDLAEGDTDVQAGVLVSLHLFLNGLSPLSAASLLEQGRAGAQNQSQSHSHSQDGKGPQQEQGHGGNDDDNLDNSDGDLDSGDAYDDDESSLLKPSLSFHQSLCEVSLDSGHVIVDSLLRIQRLWDLYPRLSEAEHVKARAAFVLAHHSLMEAEDMLLAEELYLECLVIIDGFSLVESAFRHPALLSELATSALLGYADVLVTNGKYRYGILAYEACLAVYPLLGLWAEHEVLVRRLAALCLDQRDAERAVRYYRSILDQDRTGEFVYISEVITDIYTDTGDFALAEATLLSAIAHVDRKVKLDEGIYAFDDNLAAAAAATVVVPIPSHHHHHFSHQQQQQQQASSSPPTPGHSRKASSESQKFRGNNKFLWQAQTPPPPPPPPPSQQQQQQNPQDAAGGLDPAVELRLRLAQLYMAGYNPDHAIALLRQLLATANLTPDRQNVALTLLAEAYIKRRRPREAHEILQRLASGRKLNKAGAGAGSASGPGGSSSAAGSSVGSPAPSHVGPFDLIASGPGSPSVASGGAEGTGSARSSLDIDSASAASWETGPGPRGMAAADAALSTVRFRRLLASHHRHSGRLEVALQWLDSAVQVCVYNDLMSSLAHCLYTRGKVLSKLLAETSLKDYPTDLQPDDYRPGDLRPPHPAHHVPRWCAGPGDLAAFAHADLSAAMRSFRDAGDAVRVSKAAACISALILRFALPRVAYFGWTLEEAFFELGEGGVCAPRPLHPSSFCLVHAPLDPRKALLETTRLALEICADTCPALPHALAAFLNAAELEFLLGNLPVAKAYWAECRDGLALLLPLARTAPLTLSQKLRAIFERLIALLFAFDQETVADHLALIDSFLTFCNEVRWHEQEPVEAPVIPPKGSDGGGGGGGGVGGVGGDGDKGKSDEVVVSGSGSGSGSASGSGSVPASGSGSGASSAAASLLVPLSAALSSAMAPSAALQQLHRPVAMPPMHRTARRLLPKRKGARRAVRLPALHPQFAEHPSREELAWKMLHLQHVAHWRHARGDITAEEMLFSNAASLAMLGRPAEPPSLFLESRRVITDGLEPHLQRLVYGVALPEVFLFYSPVSGLRVCYPRCAAINRRPPADALQVKGSVAAPAAATAPAGSAPATPGTVARVIIRVLLSRFATLDDTLVVDASVLLSPLQIVGLAVRQWLRVPLPEALVPSDPSGASVVGVVSESTGRALARALVQEHYRLSSLPAPQPSSSNPLRVPLCVTYPVAVLAAAGPRQDAVSPLRLELPVASLGSALSADWSEGLRPALDPYLCLASPWSGLPAQAAAAYGAVHFGDLLSALGVGPGPATAQQPAQQQQQQQGEDAPPVKERRASTSRFSVFRLFSSSPSSSSSLAAASQSSPSSAASGVPAVLILDRALSALPWEAILPSDRFARSFLLEPLLRRYVRHEESLPRPHVAGTLVTQPQLLACSARDESRYFEAVDVQRSVWVAAGSARALSGSWVPTREDAEAFARAQTLAPSPATAPRASGGAPGRATRVVRLHRGLERLEPFHYFTRPPAAALSVLMKDEDDAGSLASVGRVVSGPAPLPRPGQAARAVSPHHHHHHHAPVPEEPTVKVLGGGVTLCDVSRHQGPRSLLRIVDANTAQHCCPILVLSHVDLVDPSEALWTLARERRGCVCLFLPATQARPFAEAFLKAVKKDKKKKKDIMPALEIARTQTGLPVAIMNPPQE